MGGHDEAGAVAATRYFLALYEYVRLTGDVTEWERVSGQTCEFCSNVRDDVLAVYAAGGHYVHDRPTSFAGFEPVSYDEQIGVYTVRVRFDAAESHSIDRGGATVGTAPAESGEVLIDVIPSARGWLLLEGDSQ